jgi:hypothetical protein
MSIAKSITQRWPFVICVGGVIVLAASYWRYTTSVTRLAGAQANLKDCEQLAQQIQNAQQAPQRASLDTWSQDDLGSAVENAASEAQLRRDRILRIDPQSPKRLGKTDYLEQATEVELSAVTLRQLVDFLFAVQARDDQLGIGTLRLRMPHGNSGEQSPETWLADVVLTQRIYAPTTPHR